MFPWRTVLVAVLLALIAALPVKYAAADGPSDQEARQIADSLACPICEGQSVAESNSQLAREMREVIRKKVEVGQSRGEIIDYFVDRYGEGILRAPRPSGFNWILWWLPGLGLLLGVGLSTVVLRRWKAHRSALPSPDPGSGEIGAEEREHYQTRLQQELESD